MATAKKGGGAATPRPVHYSAAGTKGMAFDCWHDEFKAHRESGDPNVPENDRWMHRSLPRPKTNTDLRQVTCRACWVAIAKMAKERGL
jgi:hypothetical protein